MTDANGRERPKTRPLTPERLEAAALHYLERFAASAASLRRVLQGRVERSVREHGTDGALGIAWIEALIARYQESGLLNDAVYAEAKAATLRRRGASSRAIHSHLATRGVATETVVSALERVDADGDWLAVKDAVEAGGNADDAAARALVRRRRLGRFRPEAERAAHRARDMAALGRAGFSYEAARRAIDDDSP